MYRWALVVAGLFVGVACDFPPGSGCSHAVEARTSTLSELDAADKALAVAEGKAYASANAAVRQALKEAQGRAEVARQLLEIAKSDVARICGGG